ncbi:hypothetical protein CQY20_06300 [Mycolicibacterium agri]|uniref:MPT63-like domain-containing protein n=1 Tax=Mycolicibacterium agri TaxID=36811 RepID=A0A2A7N9U5_MYCAG|nr:DUF1942 domain-containing protein [Mycolicibacterium agri]PEG40882.1 hypothetical protein CQY20_06300 [Mycolicibacterium agri]GFG52275.1 hypothetical protein MAGR_37160 [Mycolicibacterium agri]
MEIKKLAAAASVAAVMFSFGAVGQASAADAQVFGLQQTVNDPNGGQIGYTVTRFFPSGDAIPHPVTGQLYEATVRADAVNGIVTPAVGAFSAQTASGQNYPALVGFWVPQGLSEMALLPGGHTTGKVYFDAVGEPPTTVVFNGPGESFSWTEPSTEEPASEEEEATEEEAPAEEAPAEEAPAEEAPAEEAPAEDEGAGDEADSSGNADVAVEEEEEG